VGGMHQVTKGPMGGGPCLPEGSPEKRRAVMVAADEAGGAQGGGSYKRVLMNPDVNPLYGGAASNVPEAQFV
jgi:hypothetical protein